jgi:hypothetical protein
VPKCRSARQIFFQRAKMPVDALDKNLTRQIYKQPGQIFFQRVDFPAIAPDFFGTRRI